MVYNIQENALFDANNVSLAINNIMQLMSVGDEAFLEWGQYKILTTLQITNTNRLKYCKITLKGVYEYLDSPSAVFIEGDCLVFTMDKLTSNIASDVYNQPRPGGVVIGQCNHSTFDFGEIQGLDYGIRLQPTVFNTGICYNKIYFKLISYCYICLNFSVADGIAGWVNENQIYGGRIKGYYGLAFRKGSSQIDEYNNNTFYNISFESIEEDAINCQFTSFNSFFSPRFESVNNKAIYESSTCKNNKYYISVAVPIEKVEIHSKYTWISAPLHNVYWENEFRTLITDYDGQCSYEYYHELFVEAFNCYKVLPNNCRTVEVKSDTAEVTLEMRAQSEYENNQFYLYTTAYKRSISIKNSSQVTVIPTGVITSGSYRIFFANSKWKVMKVSDIPVYSM